MASTLEQNELYNAPAKGIPYFTPAQDPKAGTLLGVEEGKKQPKLFTPLKIRGLEIQNRVIVSPMCQYSSDNGHFTVSIIGHIVS